MTEPVVMTVIEPVVTAPPPPVEQPIVVVLVKDTALHAEPRRDSAVVGVVRRGTRARMQRATVANDCRWVELEPRGWTCDGALGPSDGEPTATEEIGLGDDDDPTPIRGVYGIVRGHASAFASRDDAAAQSNPIALEGSNTVRAIGVIAIDGHRYWRTTQGTLIDQTSIYQIAPSRFRGVEITDPAVLPAWVRGRGDPYKPVATRRAPDARAPVIGTLARRTLVTVLESSADGQWVRIADATWIARANLRIATLAEPPAGTGADEKWLDVDRDEQVLIAYVGVRPVYATLVSTGKWEHETPVGVARIASKHEAAVMTSDASKGAVYSVADVPWTMYYDRDFALHTAYWHDGFGGVMSHGCVNLAPRDARLLYRWSSPDVPAGWTAVYGDADHPGTLVRVRSRATPEPAFRGYARDVLARQDASLLSSAR